MKKRIFNSRKSIALTIVLIILLASIGYYYFFRFNVDIVNVVEIDIRIDINCTDEEYREWFTDVRYLDNENSIKLPHCSRINFNGNRIVIYTDNYDKDIDTIIIANYNGIGSFSGGGDDTLKIFLEKAEYGKIVAAYNVSLELYRVDSNNNDKIVKSNAIRNGTNRIESEYIIQKEHSLYPEIFQKNRSFTINEIHNIKKYNNVRVSLRMPGQCE